VPIESFISIVAAMFAATLGGILLWSVSIRRLWFELFGVFKRSQLPYGERIARLTESLKKASREVDEVLIELEHTANIRTQNVTELENELAMMEFREKEIKQKIAALEKTPLPVAEHFAKLLEGRDKRTAKRDYLLFVLGAVVATIIAIVMQLIL